jgi:hypothetical protein
VAILSGTFFGLVVSGVLLLLAVLAGLVFVRGASWLARTFRFAAGPLGCLGFTLAYPLSSVLVSERGLKWLAASYMAVPFAAFGAALVTAGWFEFVRARRGREAERVERSR